MTLKNTNKMTVAVIMTITIAGISLVPVFAVTSTGPWSITQSITNRSCGTNLTDNNEYACAVPYSSGYSYLLTKVKDSVPSTTSTATTRTNSNLATSSFGSSPELTTSNSVVTFKSNYSLYGVIQKGSQQQAYVHYGHEIYKKNWWGGWDVVTNCQLSASTVGTTNISNQDVTCTINNSGTNTYRMAGLVDAAAQTNIGGADTPVYADFYTGSYYVKLNSLTIT